MFLCSLSIYSSWKCFQQNSWLSYFPCHIFSLQMTTCFMVAVHRTRIICTRFNQYAKPFLSTNFSPFYSCRPTEWTSFLCRQKCSYMKWSLLESTCTVYSPPSAFYSNLHTWFNPLSVVVIIVNVMFYLVHIRTYSLIDEKRATLSISHLKQIIILHKNA